MKRNDLRAMGLTPDQVDTIMTMNGADITREKAKTGQQTGKGNNGAIIKETLNKAQVEQLFNENAVLLGSRDAVPELAVVRLFGQKALDFVYRMKPKENGSLDGYGIGEYTAGALTKKGFFIAATYCNVIIIRDCEREQERRKPQEGQQ